MHCEHTIIVSVHATQCCTAVEQSFYKKRASAAFSYRRSNALQVLTIGATNLASDLDQALLRPGRFEVVYEIPNPGPVARLEILKYHARNKPLENEGLLRKVAEATQARCNGRPAVARCFARVSLLPSA